MQPPRNSGRKHTSARSGKECRSSLENLQRQQSELRVRLADLEKRERDILFPCLANLATASDQQQQQAQQHGEAMQRVEHIGAVAQQVQQQQERI